MKSMYIGIIQFSNAPYRDCTYQRLQEKYNLKLDVGTFPGVIDTHPEWNYRPTSDRRFLRIGEYLKKRKWDALCIAGYSAPIAMYAVVYSLLNGIPVILQADTIQAGRFPLIKRGLYKRVNALWIPGTRSANYFRSIGVSEEKLFYGVYTYDYIEEMRIIKSYDAAVEKKYLGIDADDTVFLFIGKLIPSRRVGLLLESFARLDSKDIRLIIIGDGPDERLLKENSDSRVIHIPAVPLAELYKYYAISDIYVHPGGEPYSLALVQAVAADMVTVTSDLVGASDDVVEHCGNGFVFTSDDAWELSEYMSMAVEYYDVMSIAASRKGRWVRENRSIEFAATQLYGAINKVVIQQ